MLLHGIDIGSYQFVTPSPRIRLKHVYREDNNVVDFCANKSTELDSGELKIWSDPLEGTCPFASQKGCHA